MAAITRDLRTPLAALAIASELLAEDADALDRGEIRRMADAIRCEALRTQGLVENLLCAAAIRKGRLRLRPVPLDLLALVVEVGAVARPLLARKGLRLRIASRGTPADVCADGLRVGQALVNLIANAVELAEPGTTILVTVAGGPDGARITVADRGAGSPSGSAPRLFEPFYGAAEDGVGLGLAIVKWIAEAHGGWVGAIGRRGGGACFWFELPPGVGHDGRGSVIPLLRLPAPPSGEATA